MLSIFKRRAATGPTAAAANEPSDAVQAARTRARRRLIGAAVLVAIGVIGFPLVFETQPRPIPVDIPIELPRKDNVAPLSMPARSPAPIASASGVVSAGPAEPRPAAGAMADHVITESREDAARDTQPSASAAPIALPVVPAVSPPPAKPSSTVSAEAAPAKPVAESAKAAPADDSARARALLEGKTPPAAEGGRYVVQVGAFADPGAARETRLKVEKLGLKTYTQVASTAAGDRIRVRVGPFATRDEADRALAKARGAGLSAVVLTL